MGTNKPGLPLCVCLYMFQGICFIRITRPELKVIYDPDEKFEVGVAKVVRQSDSDKVTVIGAGVTLHEALTAADQLASEGKSASWWPGFNLNVFIP